MIYTFTDEEVFCAEIGRKYALRKCVRDTPALNDEFGELYPFDYENMSLADNFNIYAENITKFIKDHNIRIVNETPNAYLDDEGQYKVSVRYEIEVP